MDNDVKTKMDDALLNWENLFFNVNIDDDYDLDAENPRDNPHLMQHLLLLALLLLDATPIEVESQGCRAMLPPMQDTHNWTYDLRVWVCLLQLHT